MRSSSGSITSPLPEMISDASSLATHSSASSRRSRRSVRQSLASSIAARVRLPYCSSFASNSSNSVKASAVPPAKPAITLPPARRRTLRALPFMMVLPMLTWPSPAIATLPWRRTETMVVPRNCSMMLFLSRRPAGRAVLCARLRLFPGPGARMSFVVYLGEVLEVKVSVDLGRGDVRVPQEFLHAAQVVARLEQVGGKGVPEQVRVDLGVDALAPRPVIHPRLYAAAAEARAPLAHEQGLFAGRCQRTP